MTKQSTFTASPIAERSQEGIDFDYNYDDAAYGQGCGCFRRLSWWSHDESQSSLLRGSAGAQKEGWLVAKLKGAKEYSEVVMGPKWKNLVRRLGKVFNGKKETTQFQYSPESYALNFAGGDAEEDGELMHSFSTRFAGGGLGNEQQRRSGL